MFAKIKIAACVVVALLMAGHITNHIQRGHTIAALQQDLQTVQTELDQAQQQLQSALAVQERMQSQLDQWQQQAQANQRALEMALQQEQQWATQTLPESIRKAITHD